MNPTTWTPPQLVLWIKNELTRRGFEGNLRLEAELLVSHGLKIDRVQLFLQFDRPLNEQERSDIRELVRRRFSGEPVAYILGDAHFWDLTLKVGSGVLIPRSDTEVLVEYLVDQFPGPTPTRALEFGIGSGAISLAWGCSVKNLEIDGLEISPQAFEYANQNLELCKQRLADNGSEVLFYLDQPIQNFEGPYDVIVSNPPYITADEMLDLSPGVKNFEPALALAGGKDGLEFYRLLFQESLRLLNPQGILVIEHGYAQKEAILKLMPPGLGLSCARQDLNKQDRMLAFNRLGEPS